MTKSTVALSGLNVFTLMFAVIGLTAQDLEPMSIALALTLVTALVNSGVHLRRTQEPAPARRIATDELDARAILDLDARLEAVERAQSDAADAVLWRALVESGQASGAADDDAEAGGPRLRGHTRNGHR